jgi:hypothetical protein
MTIFEWGAGNSSLYVQDCGNASLLSIESDSIWARAISEKLTPPNKVLFVDIGQVGPWGRPRNYDRAEHFSDYFAAELLRELRPDLVLVDGRFRLACFLTALINTDPGTRILFDDYLSRPHYSFVERFCSPSEVRFDQALFMRPEEVDVDTIQGWIERFSMVMD